MLTPTRDRGCQGTGTTSWVETGWDREETRTRGTLSLISVHGEDSGDVMVDGMAPLRMLPPLVL